MWTRKLQNCYIDTLKIRNSENIKFNISPDKTECAHSWLRTKTWGICNSFLSIYIYSRGGKKKLNSIIWYAHIYTKLNNRNGNKRILENKWIHELLIYCGQQSYKKPFLLKGMCEENMPRHVTKYSTEKFSTDYELTSFRGN